MISPLKSESIRAVLLTFLIGTTGVVNIVEAAPCCSAGSALPALITSDDVGQFSVNQSMSSTVMDASSRGPAIVRSDSSAESTLSTRILAATKISEYFQIGGGFSFLSRSTSVSGKEFQESGLGDTELSVGYEFLPEWNYSRYRPKGVLYLQNVFPTGKAIQDPAALNIADVRGQGVFQNVFGAAFTKAFSDFDFYVTPEIRRLHSKTFSGGTRVSGTWGGALQLGAGWSMSREPIRFSLRTQPTFQGGRIVENADQTSLSGDKWVWNTGADATYTFNEVNVLLLSYSDQTLFGPARNTTLERSLGVGYLRRWEP